MLQTLKIFFSALIICSMIACSGQRFAYQPIPYKMPSPTHTNSGGPNDPEVDKDFKIKDFDADETVEKKISYVLLGLLAAGVTATAVAVPIWLHTR